MSDEEGEICIKHAPCTCCPDYDCLYGSWDGKHCRGCGTDCAGCKRRRCKMTEKCKFCKNEILIGDECYSLIHGTLAHGMITNVVEGYDKPSLMCKNCAESLCVVRIKEVRSYD